MTDGANTERREWLCPGQDGREEGEAGRWAASAVVRALSGES